MAGLKLLQAIFALLITLCILSVCSSTLLIVQPQNTLFPNSTVTYSYANFGKVPYGRTLGFKLLDLKNELCSSEGLSRLPPSDKGIYLLTTQSHNCSHTKRALIAQALGASGVIIGSDMTHYEEGIILADDGNGKKVHITTLFVSKADQDQLTQMENVEIKVSFNVIKKDKSDVLVLLSASGRHNYVFLRDFQSYYHRLKKHINFNPIYLTVECPDCFPQDCVLNNKFCAFSIGNFRMKVGAQIVKESFRQYNVYQRHPDQYFDYMNRYDLQCGTDWYSSKECSQRVANELGITDNLNFGDQEDIMNGWRYRQTRAGLSSDPQVAINGQVFPGSLIAKDVFDMVCASLKDEQVCISQDHQSFKIDLTLLMVLLVIVLIGILLIVFLVYRRCVKRELTNDMTSKVNQLVSKYATKVNEHDKKRRDKMIERLNEEL